MTVLAQGELGPQIRRWRELREISIETLAQNAELSVDELAQIEEGQRQVDAGELARIAEVLDVSALAILRPDSLSAKVNLAIIQQGLSRIPQTIPAKEIQETLHPVSYWKDHHARILEDAHEKCKAQDYIAYCTHIEDAAKIREEAI
jgi:transcriptional regulator with XRE-family HTH domain